MLGCSPSHLNWLPQVSGIYYIYIQYYLNKYNKIAYIAL